MKHRYSLKMKMIFLYLMLGLFPMLALFAMFIRSYTDSIRHNTESLFNYACAQVAGNISAKATDLQYMLASMMTDSEMINLYSRFTKDGGVANPVRFELQNKLIGYGASNKDVIGLALINETEDYASYIRYYSLNLEGNVWVNQSYRRQVIASTAYKDSPRQIGETFVFSSRQFPDLRSVEEPSVYFVFPFYSLTSDRVYGHMVLEAANSMFTQVIDQEVANHLQLAEGLVHYIVNENGTIVSASNPEYIGLPVMEMREYTDAGHISKVSPVGDTTLSLHSFLDEGVMTADVIKFQRAVTPVLAAVCALFLFAVFLITNRYTKSIRSVSAGIRKFSEDAAYVRFDMHPSDDLYAITSQFNHMVARIRKLLGDLEERNVRIQENADLCRKAEIQALQAQINPHFLYNTLDSINWMAIQSGQQEISSMLSALASLLRYSVSNIDTVVPLGAELLWLDKYVYLQRKRFSLPIEIHKEIADEDRAMSFPIHKMLLQPIVENSILHGFDKRSATEPVLLLEARILPDERLMLSLRDNGIGMDADTLARVERQITGEKAEGIGLQNIQSRLELYYGNRKEILIKSAPGQGTEVTLIIPAADAKPFATHKARGTEE